MEVPIERQAAIAQFKEFCAVEDDELAVNLLTEASWNVERAVRTFFGNENENDEDQEFENPEPSAPFIPPSESERSRNAAAGPVVRQTGWLELLSNLVFIPVKFFVWSLREALNFFFSFFGGPPIPLADPTEEIRRFVGEFREKYDPDGRLPWLQVPYQSAVNETRRSINYLVIYLHNPTHARTDDFVRNYLLSTEFTDFIRTNNCLLWGASTRSSEGYKVASALQDHSYPLVALLCIMNGRMTCVYRMSGQFTLTTLMEGLQNTTAAGQHALNLMRQEQAQREQTNRLRLEQEQDYERSLAADRVRLQERRRLESERVEAEKREEEERQREIQKQKKLDDHRSRLTSELPKEPELGVEGVIRVAFRFPSGTKAERRFLDTDSLEKLFNAAFANESCPRDFSLLSGYPPKELQCAPDWYHEFSPTAADSSTQIRSFRDAGFKSSVVVFIRDNEA
ncbi:hypothetical protein M3Y94_00787400 [Aphelenchoides besseyi]|nr:hypothetical protein M3Y94_00787400 [Aphelenchoides besseyi]KAI6232410.1 UBX domain protein [Aphelenchoides besseyi]